MRQLPSLAVFKSVDIAGLAGSVLSLHVFVLPITSDAADPKPETFLPPGVTATADGKGTKCTAEANFMWEEAGHALYSAKYAGSYGIFAGRGDGCASCRWRNRENVVVDITATLNRLGNISRHEVELAVFVEDQMQVPTAPGFLTRFATSKEIPLAPVITGPLFEDADTNLKNHAYVAGKYERENKTAQRYLQASGHGNHKVDGHYGPNTEASVKSFQKFNGLKADGIIGPVTKSLMMRPRLDYKSDSLGSAYPYGNRTIGESVTEVVVSVGEVPGYLKRRDTIAAIYGILQQWEQGVPFKFKLMYTPGEATAAGPHQHAVNVFWSDKDTKGRADELDVEFGVQGGALAHADDNIVVIDSAERWLLPTSKRDPRLLEFSLVTVVLHEFGHVLGLEHSKFPVDVMSPYYIENQFTLSPRDIARVKALYPAPAGEEKNTEATPPAVPAAAAASAV